MSESFILTFMYKGKEQEIACSLRTSAYTYQFLCLAGEQEIIIEKDDEGNLRALTADPFSGKHAKTDSGLVKALIEELEKILH